MSCAATLSSFMCVCVCVCVLCSLRAEDADRRKSSSSLASLQLDSRSETYRIRRMLSQEDKGEDWPLGPSPTRRQVTATHHRKREAARRNVVTTAIGVTVTLGLSLIGLNSNSAVRKR